MVTKYFKTIWNRYHKIIKSRNIVRIFINHLSTYNVKNLWMTYLRVYTVWFSKTEFLFESKNQHKKIPTVIFRFSLSFIQYRTAFDGYIVNRKISAVSCVIYIFFNFQWFLLLQVIPNRWRDVQIPLDVFVSCQTVLFCLQVHWITREVSTNCSKNKYADAYSCFNSAMSRVEVSVTPFSVSVMLLCNILITHATRKMIETLLCEL